MVYLLSEDPHIRTNVNRHLENPCIYQNSPEKCFRLIKDKKDNPTILIFDIEREIQNIFILHHELKEEDICLKVIFLMRNSALRGNVVFSDFIVIPKRFSSSEIRKALLLSNHVNTEKESELEEDIFSSLIGSSKEMRVLKDNILRLAGKDARVLIIGESGTGKEIVADILAKLMFNERKKLIKINSAAFTNSLAESRLLGYRKGSFSGALEDREGFIEKAHGKILFLDEIESIKEDTQAILLRVLDSGEFYRVGETDHRYSDFSLISASNMHPQILLTENRIRLDFVARIAEVVLFIPALRERKEDIPELIAYYEKKMGYEKNITDFSLFLSYDWPGNVRELFAVIKRVHILDPEELLITKEYFNQII